MRRSKVQKHKIFNGILFKDTYSVSGYSITQKEIINAKCTGMAPRVGGVR